MFDPYLDARLDQNAFPPIARALSLVLSVAVVGVLLFQAFGTAAAIVA
jgi:hypothetical protein